MLSSFAYDDIEDAAGTPYLPANQGTTGQGWQPHPSAGGVPHWPHPSHPSWPEELPALFGFCGQGHSGAATTTANIAAGDSQIRHGQPGFPETRQQCQQPRPTPHQQSPLNVQLSLAATLQNTGPSQQASAWGGTQHSLLQLPPLQPPPPPLPQLRLQRPQSQPAQQHQHTRCSLSALTRHGSAAAARGAAHGGPVMHHAGGATLNVRQYDFVLDEQSGVNHLLTEIRSAPWPAPEPQFKTDALLPTWQLISASPCAAAAATAPAGAGTQLTPLPGASAGGGRPWTVPAGLGWAQATSTGPLSPALGPPSCAGGTAFAAPLSTVAAAASSLQTAPVAEGRAGVGPAWAATAAAAAAASRRQPPAPPPAVSSAASPSSDTGAMGSPFVTLAGLWAQEAGTPGPGPQQAATAGLAPASQFPGAAATMYGPSPAGVAPGPVLSGRGAAVLPGSGWAQSHTAPPAGGATAVALVQPPSLSRLLPSGSGEPVRWHPAAPSSSEPASVRAVDVEQLFGRPGALAAAAGGGGRWQVPGGSGSVPDTRSAGGLSGQSMPSGLQSVLSDFADVSFSGAEDMGEAGDALLDSADTDWGVGGVDAGGGGGGLGGGGAGGGGGDLGGFAESVDGGGAGRSITLEDLRPLFDRQVDEVVRLLRVGVNDFKRRCRALGMSRWPQRKLLSLRKMEEAVRGDRGLSEERRQVVLASIARNREAILEAPDTALEPGLKLLRQAHYKRHFMRRKAAGGRGGGGGGSGGSGNGEGGRAVGGHSRNTHGPAAPAPPAPMTLQCLAPDGTYSAVDPTAQAAAAAASLMMVVRVPAGSPAAWPEGHEMLVE